MNNEHDILLIFATGCRQTLSHCLEQERAGIEPLEDYGVFGLESGDLLKALAPVCEAMCRIKTPLTASQCLTGNGGGSR